MRAGGALCDVGPTLLTMLGLEQPTEMTGIDLRLLRRTRVTRSIAPLVVRECSSLGGRAARRARSWTSADEEPVPRSRVLAGVHADRRAISRASRSGGRRSAERAAARRALRVARQRAAASRSASSRACRPIATSDQPVQGRRGARARRPSSRPLYSADFGLGLSLTGAKSWHHLVPEIAGGLGFVSDLQTPSRLRRVQVRHPLCTHTGAAESAVCRAGIGRCAPI